MEFDFIELLKNKRYRSILILIGYVIFFIVLAILFRSGGGVKPAPVVTKSPMEIYCQMANYEYRTDYEMGSDIFYIEGKNFRTDNYFKLDEQEYYLKDGKFYLYSEEVIGETGLDFDFYDNKMICDLLDKGNLVSKNENFEDNSMTNKYSVYDDIRDTNIYISYKIKDEEINDIEIDLSQDDYKYVIKTNYSNIGQVTNFTSMFDEEKIIKGVEE